jgi:uncharacterized protein
MKKVEMEITDIALSGSSSGAYAMVLGEVTGNRKLPIVIGGAEAQAIAIEMEKMKASRPLTHDLFKSAFTAFEIRVTEVLIYNMVEGIFFAKLICVNHAKEVEIDCRPSDAVALAYRFGCPIQCYESVLQTAGIKAEELEESEDAFEDTQEDLIAEQPKAPSLTELENELAQALAREDYEKASQLRDQIDQLKKTN